MDRAIANGRQRSATTTPISRSRRSTGRGRRSRLSPVASFYADAAAGTLPNICFVDPPFRDGGGGDGLSADEHPHGDIRLGQAFMSDVVHAFIESPQYERGALFINYDEWGGFFDHVAPPFVPDDRRNRADIDKDWGLTGFRDPRRRDLALHARRQGQPHAGHPRVDPEADLLPVRPRPPEQAPPLRVQHRPLVRLAEPRPRAARAAGPDRDRGDAVLGAAASAAGRAAKPARHGRARDLRLPRPARRQGPRRERSTRSSASPTRCGGRWQTPSDEGVVSASARSLRRCSR